MTTPLVSVVIPAHNAAPWIAETLQSVLAQRHRSIEIIVVDDGSTDDTRGQIEPYRAHLTLIEQASGGPGAARNAGCQAAAGEYIALLDHDDLWAPEKLEVQLSIASRHPESGLIACDGVEFDGTTIRSPRLHPDIIGRRLTRTADGEWAGDVYPELVRECLINCPAQTLLPREVVDRVGPMTTTRGEPSDWDYYLRIAAVSPITFHRHSLVRWRYVPSSRSGRSERRAVVWGLMNVRLLSRHVRLRTLPRRDLLLASLALHVRSTARAAYYLGRRGDVAFARSHLWRLARLAPGRPVVWAHLLALTLPPPLASRARRVVTRWGGSTPR